MDYQIFNAQDLWSKSYKSTAISDALSVTHRAGYSPLFIPELAELKAQNFRDSHLWEEPYRNITSSPVTRSIPYITPSIKAVGRTKAGNRVLVYAHIPSTCNNPDFLEYIISQDSGISKREGRLLINGSGIMPPEEFYDLLEKEDGTNVFVLDWNKTIVDIQRFGAHAQMGFSRPNLDEVLEHPIILPFFGSTATAKRYLKVHRREYKKVFPLHKPFSIGVQCDFEIDNYRSLGDPHLFRLLGLGDNDYWQGFPLQEIKIGIDRIAQVVGVPKSTSHGPI